MYRKAVGFLKIYFPNESLNDKRVQTILNFNGDDQHVELGGEHINSDQLFALNLCKELNIELVGDRIFLKIFILRKMK
ncbi:hypothetical protein AXG55_07795 [Silvanigrella aquatica]|uniref:Uncharacterized protein n=1 Tax=Silvanigrella aquatica TaxID=1915309 RepID=A0A1L4D0T7_9BACT|nr:hypothetical protein AXG55_07795 [Silvanigrella aquatica]